MCGHSSVVERLVANEKVEGSTPFARSKRFIAYENLCRRLEEYQSFICNG